MTVRRHFLASALTLASIPAMDASAADPIRMGYFESYWPFSRLGGDGLVMGLLVDVVNRVGRRCGLGFEHTAYPWARAQLMVERGTLDGFCTVRTQDRLRYVEFCETPLVTVRFGIYHRADDLRPLEVRSIEDLRQLRQGNYRGSGYSREHLEMDRMQIADDGETVLRLIARNHLDVLVDGELVIDHKVRELGLADKIRFTPAPFLPRAEFRFGLRRSYPDAGRVLERMESATLAAEKSGELQAALKKYR